MTPHQRVGSLGERDMYMPGGAAYFKPALESSGWVSGGMGRSGGGVGGTILRGGFAGGRRVWWRGLGEAWWLGKEEL